MMPSTSNYQDYRDLPPQQGTRHVSDSNMTKYNNYYKPQQYRGQSTSSDSAFHHQNNQYAPGQSQYAPVRSQTPSYDRPPLSQPPRGQTPSYEQEQRNMNYRNNNYQVFPRGATPTNVPTGSHWNYAEDSEMRRGNIHMTSGANINSNRDVHRQEMLTPRDGNYGNTPLGYSDPVYSAMAGKRPVKSLQQPNSAKV